MRLFGRSLKGVLEVRKNDLEPRNTRNTRKNILTFLCILWLNNHYWNCEKMNRNCEIHEIHKKIYEHFRVFCVFRG